MGAIAVANDIDENGYVTGPWSEMDLFDLANGHRRNDTVTTIAQFLCRAPSDVTAKLNALRKTGELDRLIALAAADVGGPLPSAERIRTYRIP